MEGILKLEDVRPGMMGEWKTVVSGTEVESYELRVVGGMEGFIHPDYPVILCEILDPGKGGLGPVSGMSGSPVYLEGLLAGAYAYGFPWTKGRALVGVTPIELMMDLRAGAGSGESLSAERLGAGRLWAERIAFPETRELPARLIEGAGIPGAALRPLVASGLSGQAFQQVRPWFEARGLEFEAIPAGRMQPNGADEGSSDLVPGSPVAALLTTGDIRLGGVGTVTWREGDEVLAFGHRFLQQGEVSLPMASAEIVDVVGSYRLSFKLSNIGSVIGSIDRDLVQGIRGRVGAPPRLVPITVSVDGGDHSRTYHGGVAEARELTSLAATVYLAEGIFGQAEGVEEQTILGQVRLRFNGSREDLVFEGGGIGTAGALSLIGKTNWVLGVLYDNPFLFPEIAAVEVEVGLRPGRLIGRLERFQVDRTTVAEGDTYRARLAIRDFDQALRFQDIEIPIARGWAGRELELLVADGETLEEMDRARSPYDAGSFTALLGRLGQLRGDNHIYLRLLQTSPGIRLEGVEMEDLPESILALYRSGKTAGKMAALSSTVLWEKAIPVEGIFRGSHRHPFKVVPQ